MRVGRPALHRMPSATPQEILDNGPCYDCQSDGVLRTVGTVKLADWWAESTSMPVETPQEIMARAGCFACLSPHELATIQTQLLAEILEELNPGVDVSRDAIMARAGCFACLEPGLQKTIMAILLSEIAEEAGSVTVCRTPLVVANAAAVAAVFVDAAVTDVTLISDGNGSNAKFRRNSTAVGSVDGVNIVADLGGARFARLTIPDIEATTYCAGAAFGNLADFRSVTISSAFDEVNLSADANGSVSWFYRNAGSVAVDDGVNTIIDNSGVHFTRLSF